MRKIILNWSIYLFVLALPWQTHYLFKNGATTFTDIKLYGFDILWLVVVLAFIAWWYQQPGKPKLSKVFFIASACIVLVSLSAYWSIDRTTGLVALIRILQAVMLLGIVRVSKVSIEMMLHVFIVNGLVQSVFVVWQTLNQAVTGNSWLGIADQSAWISGTPVVLEHAGRWIRGFGTMPHPNAAAAIILMALLAALVLWRINPSKRLHHLLLAMNIVLTFGLFLTYSRSAIVVWLVVSVVSVAIRYRASKFIIASALALSVAGIIYLPLIESRVIGSNHIEQLSISERQNQYQEATGLLKKKWPQGVGIGNYTLAIETDYPQPVHSLPLLILVETGVFASLLLFLSITWIVTRLNSNDATSVGLTLITLSILTLGILDHYWWTLPSMLFLWAIIMGLQIREGRNS